MIISVTQSHIDRGCRGDGQNCPVALAIEEATGYTVLVESDWITAVDHNFLRWRTPPIVKIKIDLFDAGELIEPFEFELDVEGSWMSLAEHNKEPRPRVGQQVIWLESRKWGGKDAAASTEAQDGRKHDE